MSAGAVAGTGPGTSGERLCGLSGEDTHHRDRGPGTALVCPTETRKVHQDRPQGPQNQRSQVTRREARNQAEGLGPGRPRRPASGTVQLDAGHRSRARSC